ncbi:MAG: ArgE/DapE family deacylase [Thermoleophilia bacterium]|nr:ArgE/DapE family deacylase [Thermoleophilia bacterium]
MGMSDPERRVVAEIERGRDELVALAADLIAFDTTARNRNDPPRQERELQEYLGGRLRRAGAEVELFEPDRAEFAGKPLHEPGMGFEGRPQLVARFPGAGGGRSLLFNGHIDVVSVEPRDRWTSDPFLGEVRDGNLYGRGSCDMKGGIACMVYAAETLSRLGVPLAGDLLVTTNTDEESSGAGGLALVLRGVRADGGIVAEPTGFDIWISCRGTSYAAVTVPGRPGHAEVFQPHWREGGAVNAIEKARIVLDAILRLRDEWSRRSDLRHPRLSSPDILPTMISAGEWAVTYPAECRITIAVLCVPQQTDAEGWTFAVEREVEEWIAAAAATDPWLAANPPTVEWWPNRVMSLEIPPDDPIVSVMSEATADVGRPGRLSGLDSWYDGATFTRLGGTPAIAYGPPGFAPDGRSIAHTIDEYVPVDGLVACAQGLAVAAMRFCG